MSTEHSGATISLGSGSVYKPGPKINGQLLKAHENSFTVGYTNLYEPDGTQDAETEIFFGDGAFYNAADQNNDIYIGAPTSAGASSVFAGIVIYQASIGNSTPIDGDSVKTYQKALICKQGFVEYKKALASDGTSEYVFADARVGHGLYIRNSDGKAIFSASTVAASVRVGTVIIVNPDAESWTVQVSPTYA